MTTKEWTIVYAWRQLIVAKIWRQELMHILQKL